MPSSQKEKGRLGRSAGHAARRTGSRTGSHPAGRQQLIVFWNEKGPAFAGPFLFGR